MQAERLQKAEAEVTEKEEADEANTAEAEEAVEAMEAVEAVEEVEKAGGDLLDKADEEHRVADPDHCRQEDM